MDRRFFHAAIRYRAAKAGVLNVRHQEIERSIERLWKALWKAIGPQLNADIATLAARYRYPWRYYKMLLDRPDLLRVLERAPGIAPRFREIQPAKNLKKTIVDLLDYRSTIQAPVEGDRDHHYGESAAFQAWARSVPWSPEIFPYRVFDRLDHAHRVKDPECELLFRIARLAEDEKIFDPNFFRRIRDPQAWILFHTAIASQAPLWLIRMIHRDPDAAVRAFDRIHTSSGGDRGLLLDDAQYEFCIKRVREWECHAPAAARLSQDWAERLKDPQIAFDPPLTHIRGISRLAREFIRYQKRKNIIMDFRTRNFFLSEQLTDPLPENKMLFYAPRYTIRQVVLHPDFRWERYTSLILLSDPSLRLDPAIRPRLLEDANDPYSIEYLLRDHIATEQAMLWKRWAPQEPWEAVAFIKQHGFLPDAHWTPADLEILFRKGGALAAEGMKLIQLLPSSQESRPANLVSAPTMQRRTSTRPNRPGTT